MGGSLLLKIKTVSVLLLFSFVLIGCQNNNLNLSDDVTSIEVYEWVSDDKIATITDEAFMTELVKFLNKANYDNTSNKDFRSPDYKVNLLNNSKTIYTLGYYNNVMDLGSVEGRYLDLNEALFYDVELKLLLE
jgi:hypothetical protein